MNEQILNAGVLDRYAPYDRAAVRADLMQALAGLKKKVVVLDDDPTGIQTVHDVYVYTDWTKESIYRAFEAPENIFFLLTNSRGLSEAETTDVHREIARAVTAVAQETGQDFLVISRGDSTLRGHYPLETETLRRTLEEASGCRFDGEIILPFFLEGGRFTIDNVHYVRMGDKLVPVGQTEFAGDKTFGYRSSNLCEWIEEKTQGAYTAGQVTTISLDRLRCRDVKHVAAQLKGLHDFAKVIVNAIDYPDVEVFVTALIDALKAGKRFLYRSAAALTKVIGGVSDRDVLTRDELVDEKNSHGGLIVVGSHVKKTTQQLEGLKKADFIDFVEFNQHTVVDDAAFAAEQARVQRILEEKILAGRTVAVYTRRERFDLGGDDAEAELKLSVRISQAVTGFVEKLDVRPNFIIAKGGITSSEIGTRGLGVKRALVLGQILKGIPVWLTGPESRFPNMPYVIFPGNVGSENALYEAVCKLQRDPTNKE